MRHDGKAKNEQRTAAIRRQKQHGRPRQTGQQRILADDAPALAAAAHSRHDQSTHHAASNTIPKAQQGLFLFPAGPVENEHGKDEERQEQQRRAE